MNPHNTTQETGQTATYTNRDLTVVISIAQYHFFFIKSCQSWTHITEKHYYLMGLFQHFRLEGIFLAEIFIHTSETAIDDTFDTIIGSE